MPINGIKYRYETYSRDFGLREGENSDSDNYVTEQAFVG
tara:strand:+ start:283 stop:399 length:117 start_codon:yes stop_codon:yes gene_type:complete